MALYKYESIAKAVAEGGFAGLYADEVLEWILLPFYSPEVAADIAIELVDTFGGLTGVFNANRFELLNIAGITETVALHLSRYKEMLERIAEHVTNENLYMRKVGNFKKIARLNHRVHDIEEFYLVCLDKNFRIIVNQKTNIGNEVSVKIDMAKLARIVLKSKCKYVFVTHNHPIESCIPSIRDVAFTCNLHTLLEGTNIKLLDHMIVASNNEIYSFQENGMLDSIRDFYRKFKY